MTNFKESLKKDLREALQIWHPKGFAVSPEAVMEAFEDRVSRHLQLLQQLEQQGRTPSSEYQAALKGVLIMHTSLCRGELREDREYHSLVHPALLYCGLEKS